MTHVNKLVNPQHSGNDPADIWIGIRLNPEIRIRIADHFHLSLDILAEVCAIWIQSGCYTIISRMWKSLACLTRITGFRANYYLCSWYSVCKPDNVRVVQRLFGQVPDYITSLLTPVGHQHSITLFTARLQQWRPYSTKNRPANWWPCILCRRTSCMESPTDRTETHAVVDSNIQASSEVFFFAQHTDYVMHLQAWL